MNLTVTSSFVSRPPDRRPVFLRKILDIDGNGEISIDEFIQGAMTVSYPPQSKHMLGMSYDVLKLDRKFDELSARVNRFLKAVCPEQSLYAVGGAGGGAAPPTPTTAPPAGGPIGRNGGNAAGGSAEDGAGGGSAGAVHDRSSPGAKKVGAVLVTDSLATTADDSRAGSKETASADAAGQDHELRIDSRDVEIDFGAGIIGEVPEEADGCSPGRSAMMLSRAAAGAPRPGDADCPTSPTGSAQTDRAKSQNNRRSQSHELRPRRVRPTSSRVEIIDPPPAQLLSAETQTQIRSLVAEEVRRSLEEFFAGGRMLQQISV